MAELPALVAPDKFKGTLSAPEVAAAVARGLRAGGHEAVELPVADGGDGTLDALMSTLDGSLEQVSVSDYAARFSSNSSTVATHLHGPSGCATNGDE